MQITGFREHMPVLSIHCIHAVIEHADGNEVSSVRVSYGSYCEDAIVFGSIVFKFIAVMQCESEFIFILISYFEFPVEFTDYFHEIAVIERITMEFTPFSNIHIPTIIIMDWRCTLFPAEPFVDFT